MSTRASRDTYRSPNAKLMSHDVLLVVTERLACLTLDVEPDDPGDPRIWLFDEPERFSWFRDVLRNAGAPLTAFVLMKHAQLYAAPLATLSESVPVELGVHSYSHDRENTASVDEVRRARDEFIRLWGTAPHGYRAPYGLIDFEGVRTLMNEGFEYDSSIFPVFRPDEFGYNNLRFPRTPFLFSDRGRDIIEIPLAALGGCRLLYSLSFVKLFGAGVYRNLMHVFSLPEIAVIDLHPYDFYAEQIASAFKSWKRAAHLRNAARAPELFVGMIETLRRQGYRFVTVGEVAKLSSAQSLRRISLPSGENERERSQAI